MHFTIITGGSRGDIAPYVALGAGLQAAGHQVRLASSTENESLVVTHGIEFFPVRLNLTSSLASSVDGEAANRQDFNLFRRVYHVRHAFQNAETIARSLLRDTWSACQDTDVILASPVGFGAHHVAEKLALPCYWALLQPMHSTGAFPFFLVSPRVRLGTVFNRLSYRVAGRIAWGVVKRVVNDWRQNELGLSKLSQRGYLRLLAKQNVATLYGFSEVLVAKPADWSENQHISGYWRLDEPNRWHPSEELDAFLGAGPPPIYIAFGNVATRQPDHTLDLILEALLRTGQRAIIHMGWHKRTRLPNHVHEIGFAPLDQLLPSVAAVIHHGGAGTTAATLCAEKPAFVIPGAIDQLFWGHRLAATGAGPAPIPAHRITLNALIQAINVITTSTSMRARARTIGSLLRVENGAGPAVEILERGQR